MGKQKKTPKRRTIEHKPVEVSPKALRRQRIAAFTQTLKDLDEMEDRLLAEQANG